MGIKKSACCNAMYVEINIRDFLKKLHPYDETELDLIIKLQILYLT